MVMPLLISRRRGVRRPGRGRGVLRPLRPARAPHRRLGPFHRQQPDRLHHLSALLALLALSVRRRQDGRGADLPRQRRRPGGGGLRRQGRDRVPPEVPEAGRHRHVLLPPLRPQRGRRAGVHAAADVQGDQARIRRRWRSTPRSWSTRASSPRAKSRRCRPTGAPSSMPSSRRPGLQAEQGRLARRPLVRHQGGARRRRSAPRPHRRRARDAEGDRRRRSPRCRRASTSTAPSSASSMRAPRRSRPARASTGRPARRWPSARCCSKAIRSGSPARTSSAAPSRSAIRCSSTRRTRSATRRSTTSRDEPGALRGHQLDAVGRGGARLRVRLFARRAERADAVGSAVRRLRQRRAGGVRPVHLVGRAQVAAHVRPRLPAAARLRGAGAGAFLGAARALPAAVRRGQHAGRQLHDAGELLPHPAPAAAARLPQAADPDDAEVAAAPQARGLAARRDGAGHDVPPPAVGRRADVCRTRRSSSSPTTRSAAS